MAEPITLLQEPSPSAPLMAVVETDGTTVYLYLHGGKGTGFAMRALWVANLSPAPETPDVDRMQRGEPPRLVRSACAHPQGRRLSELEPLKLTWFEEGTGVALYGRGELLAILPAGAAAHRDFPGFAAGCTHRTQVAWPMGVDAGATLDRVALAEAFWRSWEGDGAWGPLREALRASIDAALGTDGDERSFDEGEWPPRLLVRRRVAGVTVLCTAGLCIRPQPGSARVFESAQPPRRIELAIAVRDGAPPDSVASAAEYIQTQSELPWAKVTRVAAGHTLGCSAFPVTASGLAITAVLCLERPVGAPSLTLPGYEADAPAVLWLLPITAAEREQVRTAGAAAVAEALGKLPSAWAFGDRPEAGVA